MLLIFLILSISFNFAAGYAGQVNFAHISLFGAGAYTSAILSKAGYPFLAAIAAAGLLAGIIGALLSLPTRKIKGDFLVLATLAFSFLAQAIFINWFEATRGPLGIPGVPKPEIFGIVFRDNFSFFFLALAFTAIVFTAIWLIVNSPFGRAMKAVRDDELSAKVLGKNTYSVKTKVLFISSFCAGTAGSLFAHFLSFVGPTSFDLATMVVVLSIVIVGGLASIKGTVIAGIIIYGAGETLRFMEFPPDLIGPARLAIFSLLIILVLVFRPKGLFGKIGFEW